MPGDYDLWVRVAVLEERVRTLAEEQKQCVSRQEFWPVRTIVYGLAGAVGATVAVAILRLAMVG